MGASEFMFSPRALRRSPKSEVAHRVLYSRDISRTLGKKEAHMALYFYDRSFPKPYPDEVQWNVFRVRPSLGERALVIELTFDHKTPKKYEYSCDRHIDFVYLWKEVFRPDDPPQKCWLGVWW